MVRRLPVINDVATHLAARRGFTLQGQAPRSDASPSSDVKLTMRSAESIAGTLGHPSKMPGFSYGISAQLCNVGSKLRTVPGSVCSGCYAMSDWYRSWRPLLQGHAHRERGIRHPRWVEAMTFMINRKCREEPWFRWHDSGDLRGIWHLENIVEVCERTPTVQHWLPTREYDVVAGYLASGKPFPPNLTVRLSAHMIDSDPVVPDLIRHLPTSTVSTAPSRLMGEKLIEGKGSVECRAVEARDNKCGPCRACWDSRVTNVQYPQH